MGQHLNTAWHHIRRSPYQAFAAVFIMMQTFVVISFFSFLVFGSSVIISYFESIPEVTAFFKEEAKQEEINALQKQIEGTGKTSKIEFVSKQDALKIYREQNKEDPLLLDLVSADILPSALKVSTLKIDDLNVISGALSSSPLVAKVLYQKDVVKNLVSWTNALRKIGLILILILALDSIFIMVIIIGIKISQKKEEIEIMRLIGATHWYIRWPFILEGVFYGLVGAVTGWLMSSAALLYATPFLTSFLRGVPLFPIPLTFFFGLLGAELLLAILLGVIASFLAVLRYLK